MQYIVLDLEWNQPITFQGGAYRSSGGKLIFEMIQIGAVKLDENREICGTFNQLIQPSCYLRLHPHIRKMTHITEEDLMDAPQFGEAYARFTEWCGDDCVLLTWGCDDISVFEQNLHYFACETPLKPVCDMQRLFGDVIGNSKERKSLKSAMEYYGIDPNENKAFHNALNDAYYTALVFARLPEPDKVLNYQLKARNLIHQDRRKKTSVAISRVARGQAIALRGQFAQKTPCPVCGKPQKPKVDYVRQQADLFQALAVCPDHGLYFSKLRFFVNNDKKKVMERTTALSEEQNKAYVSTKLIQWQNKLSAQQKAQEEAQT
ncbi:MAG: exonuclease domain-containing protein [Clostridia bacterium]|nr:exonuclease domain-containing protein [Clostridia bacterium]